MPHSQYSLKDQLEAFSKGEWLDRCFYFYDWFCKDASLERKARALMSKVKKFIKVMKVDVETTYVFFKNNCPLHGSLYDDFRICDVETGDVLWTVTPACGHNCTKGTADAWSPLNQFKEPLYSARNWKALLQHLQEFELQKSQKQP
jgi:hypothetical protein